MQDLTTDILLLSVVYWRRPHNTTVMRVRSIFARSMWVFVIQHAVFIMAGTNSLIKSILIPSIIQTTIILTLLSVSSEILQMRQHRPGNFDHTPVLISNTSRSNSQCASLRHSGAWNCIEVSRGQEFVSKAFGRTWLNQPYSIPLHSIMGDRSFDARETKVAATLGQRSPFSQPYSHQLAHPKLWKNRPETSMHIWQDSISPRTSLHPQHPHRLSVVQNCDPLVDAEGDKRDLSEVLKPKGAVSDLSIDAHVAQLRQNDHMGSIMERSASTVDYVLRNSPGSPQDLLLFDLDGGNITPITPYKFSSMAPPATPRGRKEDDAVLPTANHEMKTHGEYINGAFENNTFVPWSNHKRRTNFWRSLPNIAVIPSLRQTAIGSSSTQISEVIHMWEEMGPESFDLMHDHKRSVGTTLETHYI